MKSIADKIIAALFVLIVPAVAAACSLCRAQVEDGVYNADFYANLFFVLLPVTLLTIFGIGLSRAENIRALWEKNAMSKRFTRIPLIAAGILLGAGLGGFIDGIFFHQILQFHNLLSAVVPPDNLVNAKINMFWDGVFHAAVWLMTVIGLAVLWGCGKRRDVPWSGATFLGSLVAGWGLFNLIEGVINHQILGIHHVYEYAADKLIYDLAFIASGIVFLIIGGLLIRRGKRDVAARRANLI